MICRFCSNWIGVFSRGQHERDNVLGTVSPTAARCSCDASSAGLGPAVSEFSQDPTPFRSLFLAAAKHGDNIVHGDNEKLVVVFKIDGDRALGVEQDLVVLS